MHIWLLGLCPQAPTGSLPLDPTGDFRPPELLCPPYLQTLAMPLGVTQYSTLSQGQGLKLTVNLSKPALLARIYFACMGFLIPTSFIMDFSRGNIKFVRDQTVLSGLT